MTEDSLTYEQAGKFLEAYAALFNRAVRTGDYEQFLEMFADDAVLDYEGVPDWGPYEGWNAIAERYRDDPPDDQIRITRWRSEGGRIVAEFRWRDIPEARGGDIIIVPHNGRIARLTIAFGGPATRWH